jgi:aspartate aminotransferase
MRVLSRRVQEIDESQTLAFTQMVRRKREEGVDVISLTAGEPDFPTPLHIKEAAIKAIRSDFTHYTANEGTPELLRAIVEKFAADNDLHYSADQIIVSSGAKQSIFNALRALLNPGDEVLILSPYWVSYPAIVQLAEGIPVIVPCSIDDGFEPNMSRIRSALTSRTRALILNSPGNPTGTVFGPDEMTELAAFVREAGIVVISDEIYEKVIFDGRKHLSIGSMAGLANQVVTVNGVSKAYAMTGWRIGYLGGPVEIVRAAARVQGQTTNNANSIAQIAAIAALQGPQDPIKKMTAEFEKRRDFVCDCLQNLPDVRFRKPGGALYVFVNVEQYFGKKGEARPTSATDLALRLLDHHHVGVVPGEAFGDPTCIRLSFACGMDSLAEGMHRLARGLQDLK